MQDEDREDRELLRRAFALRLRAKIVAHLPLGCFLGFGVFLLCTPLFPSPLVQEISIWIGMLGWAISLLAMSVMSGAEVGIGSARSQYQASLIAASARPGSEVSGLIIDEFFHNYVREWLVPHLKFQLEFLNTQRQSGLSKRQRRRLCFVVHYCTAVLKESNTHEIRDLLRAAVEHVALFGERHELQVVASTIRRYARTTSREALSDLLEERRLQLLHLDDESILLRAGRGERADERLLTPVNQPLNPNQAREELLRQASDKLNEP